MTKRTRVTFLTAIWGERYVEEFATVSLPSYLAPGNLPLLADESDLEVVILTTEDSLIFFEQQPAFRHLKSIVSPRFLLIDDLVTRGNYGVTLTLAYARGIQDKGDAQTDTYFVFMNSDFVMAKGSGKALLAQMFAGRRAIMAPTLRASAEKVVPVLVETVDKADNTLSIPPRDLVRLTFDHLHPTVVAKTVTQSLLTCATHNQIYWQVNESTILARHHLIFMLAIKPERAIGPVVSYCDYGFVPDLVPSGDIKILSDSDEFYLLEMQPSPQEREFLLSGEKSIAAIARELSAWTTKEHRICAQTTVIFRADDPPADLPAILDKFAAFMRRLQGHMSRHPVPYQYHHFWVPGVQAWLQLKELHSRQSKDLKTELPPELSGTFRRDPTDPHGKLQLVPGIVQIPNRPLREKIKAKLYYEYTKLVGYVRKSQGFFPDLPIWHQSWADARLIHRWLRNHKEGPKLLIHHPDSLLPASIRRDRVHNQQFQLLEFKTGGASKLSKAKLRDLFPEPFDSVLCHVLRANVRETSGILEALLNQVPADGTMCVFIEHRDSDIDDANFKAELAQYVDEILPPNWLAYDVRAEFVGGSVKRKLSKLERMLRRKVLPLTLFKAPVVFVASSGWVINSCLIAINNLRIRNASSICPDYCSSAMITLRRRSDWRHGQKEP